jgi:hypothetical protein
MITDVNSTPFSFRGPLDGVATNVLRTLDKNPMANAVGIDLFAMVAPRTYVDTKERNKYAGAETFFREFTGTLIVCLSASYFAKGIAKIANKIVNPNVAINPQSWFSNDSLKYLQASHDKDTKKYVENVFGLSKVEEPTEWIDEKRWSNINWTNSKYKNIHERLKDKNAINSAIAELIDNKKISSSDSKNLQKILELRLTNLLGSDTHAGFSVRNLLRDTVDMGRDVFTNPKVKPSEAIAKIVKINKIKSIGALVMASSLGLTNQYLNRKITEKRTGKKGFVGDTDYQNKTNSSKDTSKSLWARKILASAGMLAMAITVMKIKSPADFMKKLEFTGPVTSGNAIKTVYASTLIGRFLASDSKDELRETVTRDYLGFLNWLVLGGFASKGIANLLDPKRENLFNISKEGKGLKHWLNDISLKSHNEIAVKGKDFAKKNMWKLNVAHASGLAYSTIALGILLPKLNIWVTKHKQKNKIAQPIQHISFEGFLKQSKTV